MARGNQGSERPEPYSSPMSANAPLISPQNNQHIRAITSGVTRVTKKNLGYVGTTGKTGVKRVRRSKKKDDKKNGR